MTEPQASIAAHIKTLLGTSSLPIDAGVLHVTALSRRNGTYATIAIDEHSPHSAEDLFILGLGRARADAIVITGKLLRDEPDYTIAAPPAALARWRREVLGRSETPRLCVLTRSGQLDPHHPIWSSPTRPFIVTTPDGAERLQTIIPEVECVVQTDPQLPRIFELLRERGARTIVLEAGPSTTHRAYAASLVDELMLSTYHGPFPARMRETQTPFDDAMLQTSFSQCGPVSTVNETSGRWTFERRQR